MPWDNARIQPDTTDMLRQKISEWGLRQKKAYRQTLQTVHNSSEKAAGKKGKKKKHSKVLPYHKCMHFPKQGGEFCWSTPVVKVHFRWMCSSCGGWSRTSLQKLSSACTNTFPPSRLWNNKEKCVSLWSFVACWQWADTDKSLDRWRLTCCDYLPLLELTVHQSRRPRGPGPADSIVASDKIFMIQWPRKKWEKCVKCFKCVVVLAHSGIVIQIHKYSWRDGKVLQSQRYNH